MFFRSALPSSFFLFRYLIRGGGRWERDKRDGSTARTIGTNDGRWVRRTMSPNFSNVFSLIRNVHLGKHGSLAAVAVFLNFPSSWIGQDCSSRLFVYREERERKESNNNNNGAKEFFLAKGCRPRVKLTPSRFDPTHGTLFVLTLSQPLSLSTLPFSHSILCSFSSPSLYLFLSISVFPFLPLPSLLTLSLSPSQWTVFHPVPQAVENVRGVSWSVRRSDCPLPPPPPPPLIVLPTLFAPASTHALVSHPHGRISDAKGSREKVSASLSFAPIERFLAANMAEYASTRCVGHHCCCLRRRRSQRR